MGNVLDKSCRENENTYFVINNFFPENRTVYEIKSKNVVETEGTTNDITTWRMHTSTRPGNHVHACMYTHTNV